MVWPFIALHTLRVHTYMLIVEYHQHQHQCQRLHREAYEKAIKEMLAVTIRIVRLNFIGLPRSGKTSFWRRLMRKIKNILEAMEKEQPSTGVAETGEHVIIQSLSHKIGVISSKKWSVLKDLPEEGNMLIKLIQKTLASLLTGASNLPKSALPDQPKSADRPLSRVGSLPDQPKSIDRPLSHVGESSNQPNQSLSSVDRPLSQVGKSSNLPDQPKSALSSIDRPLSHVGESSNLPNQSLSSVDRPLSQIGKSSNLPDQPKLSSSSSVNASEVVNKPEDDDISKEFLSLIGQAVQSGNTDIQKLLDDMILLINTDTGGQAEFLDLHASLVDGPSLNLLFHRLNDDLDKVFKTYYTDNNGTSTEKVDSTLTVEEVLFQALSSIACFSGCFLDDDCQSRETSTKNMSRNSRSKVMFVGTHRDKVTDDEFKQKNQLLRNKIECTDFFDKDIVKYASPGQLMLSVNNFTGDENEMCCIREKLEAVIEDSFEKIEIPVTWLVLSLYIRSKKWRTLSLTECEKLGGYLNINPEELQHALWFYHHCIGVHLYYPDVLKDTLICDIQVVFDSATNLIKNTFTDGVSERVYQNFKEKAQFSLEDLKKATSSYTDNLIPLEKLVKLLEHLGMLTVVPKVCAMEPTYFMPCVLQSARADELKIPSRRDSDPAPLIMRFNCGYVPMGLFPAMITNLVSQQCTWEDWSLIQEGLWKNKVQFYVGEDYDTVSLLSHPQFFEIAISPRQTSKLMESQCAYVRGVVEDILENVTKRIRHNYSMGYKFGFECPNHPGKDHLCVLEKESASVMVCLQNPRRKQPVELKPTHKVWFTKPKPCFISPSALAMTTPCSGMQ